MSSSRSIEARAAVRGGFEARLGLRPQPTRFVEVAGRSGRGEHALCVRLGRACRPMKPLVRVDGCEDGRDGIGIVDGGDGPHATAAVRALQGVDGPYPHQEVGPAHASGALGDDGNGAVGGGRGDDARAKVVVRCKDAMEAPQRQVGCRHEGGEARISAGPGPQVLSRRPPT